MHDVGKLGMTGHLSILLLEFRGVMIRVFSYHSIQLCKMALQ